eukprot:TRINITY_DN7443_c0_g1_i8.p2 TRINITY_DN7443_c0_g1~~TRINITY_DN7443_c0_g1_i8.p2  ORF type:complete len:135 (+),score=18.61 TRINITY_DN7443_c0_g1_i8:691-1095(+)
MGSKSCFISKPNMSMQALDDDEEFVRMLRKSKQCANPAAKVVEYYISKRNDQPKDNMSLIIIDLRHMTLKKAVSENLAQACQTTLTLAKPHLSLQNLSYSDQDDEREEGRYDVDSLGMKSTTGARKDELTFNFL